MFRALAGYREVGPGGAASVNAGLELSWRQEEVLPSYPGRDITGAASGSAARLPSYCSVWSAAAFSEGFSTAEAPGAAEPGFGKSQREGRSRQVAGLRNK